jgi:hypothetical protein
MRRRLAVSILFFLFSFGLSARIIPMDSFENKWSGHFSMYVDESDQSIYSAMVVGKNSPSYIETTFDTPISVDRKFVKVVFRVSDLDKLTGLELRLSSDPVGYNNFLSIPVPLFTDKNFNIIQSNAWVTYTFTMGEGRPIGKPDLTQVKRMGFYLGGEFVDVDFKSIEVLEANYESVVTLTFDDSYDDHFLAAEIMDQYGFAGTAYVMPREVGLENYLTEDQLEQMREAFGWDLSSHHKTPIIDFSYKDLELEMGYTIGYLAQKGTPSAAKHFAYPLGRQSRKTTLPLIRKMFSSARLAGGGAETLPPGDWHMLRTFNVMPTMSPEDIMERVVKAREQGEWLILMFHYLTPEHTPLDPLYYNIEQFNRLCEMLSLSESKVLTVDQVDGIF